MGKLEPTLPVRELALRRWDTVVVVAGHNGLACASYLARSGRQVLVLESRQRVGGACTIAEPWPGYRISPCAYLVGLLHPLLIEELNMPAYGFAWFPATAGLFVPFEDGSSIQLWDDDERCESEVRRLSAVDVDGWRDFCSVKRDCATRFGPPAKATSGSARRPRSTRSKRSSAATRRPAICSSSGRWSNVSRITSRTSAATGLPRPGRDRHQRQPP